MNLLNISWVARGSVLALTLLPAIASAQSPTPANTSKPPLFDSIGALANYACKVVDVVFTGAIILTIIFVLLAGIKYIMHGSDPAKISEAHKQLMWAAIGFAVALIAATVPSIVAVVLGTSLPEGVC